MEICRFRSFHSKIRRIIEAGDWKSGILLGFGFFYVRNLAELLAEGNQLNLIAATWIPAFSSIFISLGLILHMEDG